MRIFRAINSYLWDKIYPLDFVIYHYARKNEKVAFPGCLILIVTHLEVPPVYALSLTINITTRPKYPHH